MEYNLFKKTTMHHVAEDKHKTVYGYYVIIAAALLSAIGQYLFPMFLRSPLTYGLVMNVLQVVGMTCIQGRRRTQKSTL